MLLVFLKNIDDFAHLIPHLLDEGYRLRHHHQILFKLVLRGTVVDHY